VFGAEVNEDLLYEAVRHYLAGKRAGTHKVKTRHEVAGSGKKLWKQKGTGRARMGSVRSPSGAMAVRFTDRCRAITATSCRARCNWARCARLFREAARRRSEDRSAFQLRITRPRVSLQTLGKFQATKKVLLVDTAENRNLELSARNLEGVEVVRSHEVHPYHLLGATRILLTQAAASKLSETLAKSAPKLSRRRRSNHDHS
jgi:large subunit ribosomal protein L4